MSSKESRIAMVEAALAEPIADFHAALAATIEAVRAEAPDDPAGTEANGVGLGGFAEGRIDVGRFAALIEPRRLVGGEDAEGLRRAREVLGVLEAGVEEALHVEVPTGASLHDTVAATLAGIGRAFGAARVVEAVRSGHYVAATHDNLLVSLPFARWSRSERLRAPPLLVSVAGSDLQSEGLAEFLDGTVRIVLIVCGAAPPAPLARLITPGTFVLQATDGAGLDRMLAWEGPGVAAILPEGAAVFSHDPAAGKTPFERLQVESMPAEAPAEAMGSLSTSQQVDQLTHLSALAAPPPLPVAEAAPSAASDEPVDRLAAWLLGHADLSDVP